MDFLILVHKKIFLLGEYTRTTVGEQGRTTVGQYPPVEAGANFFASAVLSWFRFSLHSLQNVTVIETLETTNLLN